MSLWRIRLHRSHQPNWIPMLRADILQGYKSARTDCNVRRDVLSEPKPGIHFTPKVHEAFRTAQLACLHDPGPKCIAFKLPLSPASPSHHMVRAGSSGLTRLWQNCLLSLVTHMGHHGTRSQPRGLTSFRSELDLTTALTHEVCVPFAVVRLGCPNLHRLGSCKASYTLCPLRDSPAFSMNARWEKATLRQCQGCAKHLTVGCNCHN